MTLESTVEAALAAPDGVTTLDLDTARTRDLLAAADRLTTLTSLRTLTVVLDDDVEGAVRVICTHLPHLRELSIWGSHLRHGILPYQLGELTDLESLTVVSCGLRRMPATLAELPRLRTLRLRGQRFERFPIDVTRLGGLTHLQISAGERFSELPDELAGMHSLESLDLSHTLRFHEPPRETGDAFMDEIFFDSPGGTVPAVLARLPALTDLNLAHCDVSDLGPLRAASTLRCLVLDGNPVGDLGPLAGLQLTALSLSHCTELTDLSPLASVPLLRLNLSDNRGLTSVAALAGVGTLESLDLSSCGSVADFHTVLAHPALREVTADDHYARLWDGRHETVLPEPTAIRAGLRADDPGEVDRAVRDLGRLLTDSAGRYGSKDRFLTVFGLTDDGGMVDVPELDDALTRHGPRLTSDALITFVRGAFRSNDDDIRAVLIALAELVRRGDEPAQEQFIDILDNANTYYDAGHRAMDDTVYDALIEDVLPTFAPVPLAKLLLRFNSFDYLVMDGLGSLLDVALAGPLPPELSDALVALIRKRTPLDYMGDVWMYSLDALCAAELSPELHEEMVRLRDLQRRLNAGEPVTPAAEDDEEDETDDETNDGTDDGTEDETGPVDPAGIIDELVAEPDDGSLIHRLTAAQGSVERMVTLLAEVPAGAGAQLVDVAAATAHNTIIGGMMSDPAASAAVARAYADTVDRAGHSAGLREEVTSMALMSGMLTGDHELARRVLAWVPDHINLPNLAFNLACYHAQAGSPAKELHDAVRHARRLGKPAAQFRSDGDFAPYLDDPAFQAVLDSGD